MVILRQLWTDFKADDRTSQKTNKQKRSQPYSFTYFNFAAVKKKSKKATFPARIELATLGVSGRRDNLYATETMWKYA